MPGNQKRFINPNIGSQLLRFASQRSVSNLEVAHRIWDVLLEQGSRASRVAMRAYLIALQRRDPDNPRMADVRSLTLEPVLHSYCRSESTAEHLIACSGRCWMSVHSLILQLCLQKQCAAGRLAECPNTLVRMMKQGAHPIGAGTQLKHCTVHVRMYCMPTLKAAQVVHYGAEWHQFMAKPEMYKSMNRDSTDLPADEEDEDGEEELSL